MHRCPVIFLLLCAILAGCGKSDRSPKPVAPARTPSPPAAASVATSVATSVRPGSVGAAAETNAPVPATGSPRPVVTQATDVAVGAASGQTPETAAQVAPDPEIDSLIEQILALERDTDFGEAIKLGRDAQKNVRNPKQSHRVSEIMRRLLDSKKNAAKINVAINNLASGDRQRIQASKDVIEEEDELGRLFLRHALRIRDEAIALEAGRFLVTLHDTAAIPLFVEQLQADPLSPLGSNAVQALAVMAKDLKPEAALRCFGLVRADTDFAVPHVMDVLEAFFARACGRDEHLFNAAVGDVHGMDVLRNHVGAALMSSNEATVAWACGRMVEALPLLNGVRASYYTNSAFEGCFLERNESALRMENRDFPVPPGGQQSIFARWRGNLQVEHAGEYSFNLKAAPSGGALWVDDTRVLQSRDGRVQTVKLDLRPGWHAIRIDYAKGAGNGSMACDWTGPEEPGGKPGPAPAVRTPPWPGFVATLSHAAAELNATNVVSVLAARKLLAQSGAVGVLYLQTMVRLADAPQAAEAVSLLAERQAPDVLPVLLARLKAETSPTLIAALTDALRELAPLIETAVYPELYQTALAEGAEAVNPYVAILCAALVADHGDPEAFNRRVGDAHGYTALAKHVRDALAAESENAIRRACQYGTPFAPRLPSLVGRYHAGLDFSDLVFEAADSPNNATGRRFRYPDGRQDDISVRWKGFIDIVTPGKYTFFVNAAGTAVVWVDGRQVARGSEGKEKIRESLSLVKGLHRLRVDFQQGRGAKSVNLSWVPPGGERAEIPSTVLSASPSAEILTQITRALAAFSASDPAAFAAASKQLKGYGDVAAFFLNRSLRQVSEQGVAAILVVLIELRDPAVMGFVLEQKRSRIPVVKDIDGLLNGLAKKGDPKQAPWFYELMKVDKDKEFPACEPFLSRVMRDACANNEARFNALVEDPQGYATYQAYREKLAKTPAR